MCPTTSNATGKHTQVHLKPIYGFTIPKCSSNVIGNVEMILTSFFGDYLRDTLGQGDDTWDCIISNIPSPHTGIITANLARLATKKNVFLGLAS